MYENEEPMSRRIVWIVLWFVIIVAVAWAIVWLVFFRGSTTNQNGGLKNKTPQSQSSQAPKEQSGGSGKQNSNNSNNSNGGNTNNSGGNAPSTAPAAGGNPAPAPSGGSSSPTQAPNTLANTGAGDVLIPFAVATMVGSAIYYVHLSKKLTHSGDS